jgi:DNA helicase-2/ATP-dependent DNA helicase PcrA
MPTTSHVPPALLTGLNPEQAQAVTTLSGPLLVVAGPGSGKTRVLTHRIAALLATGTPPWAVLAVTFTNKAAAEMRHRLGALVGQDAARGMWVATFHSACARILRTHHDRVGLPRSFTIVDTKDSEKLIARVLEAAGELEPLSVAERKQTVRDVRHLISAAKNADQSPRDLITSGHPRAGLAATTMVAYDQALRARGAVDFDDLLTLTWHLLRDRPDVAEAYRTRFAHVLVDEFQDTNTVQWCITRALAAHGNVCVVGDADQSIYAFRGADPSVLGAFTSAFPTATTVRLGRNYRSTQSIVQVAQAVIDANPSPFRARLSTQNPPGDPVQVIRFPTDLDEARWVADQVAARGGPLSEHAALVRTNAQTRVLEMVLRERGVAHEVVGTVRYFDRAEVKDALAYLRLAVNPVDVGALERAVTAPRRGIGPATLAQVTGPVLAGQASVLEALRAAAAAGGRGAGALAGFADVVAAVRDAVARGGPAAGLRVALDAGLLAHHSPTKADEESTARVENLRELERTAEDFVAGRSGTDPQGRVVADLDGVEQTEAFVEYAALMSAAETPQTDQGQTRQAVQVATMHAAKGREWDHVYVVGLEEDICPHKRSVSDADLAEERRLLYVACSRARRTLALTHVQTRRTFDQVVQADPSRFLVDLPESVVRVDAGQPARPAPAGPPGSGRRFGAPAPLATGVSGGRTSVVRPAPGPRVPIGDLAPGVGVAHPVFGPGTVVSVGSGTVEIRFAAAIKVLSVAHAPLTLT